MRHGVTKSGDFEIFLATAPGLEEALAEEVRSKRYKAVKAGPGGVTVHGSWPEVWRANLEIRGASRVLARVGELRATALDTLEREAARIDWRRLLSAGTAFDIEATAKRSRLYHTGAIAERIARAVTAATGARHLPDGAAVTIRVRFEDNVAILSLDTSGALLHKRGMKRAVAKAPMRENLAALFLLQCGYTGHEPIVDPMCGAGTFVIEAAEIAMGLDPGRDRPFAFEHLSTFEPEAWRKLKARAMPRAPVFPSCGFDRDAGAIRMARDNAERAGVADAVRFEARDIADLVPPEGPQGLVILNPPYGVRIGEARTLVPLYRNIGAVLGERFTGWRIGLVTSERKLADATRLPFLDPGPPVVHGGLRVRLYRTR